MESPETSGVQEVEEAAKKTDAPAVGETNDIVEIQQKLTDAENQKKELLAKSNDLVGNIVWDKTEKKSTPQFVLH